MIITLVKANFSANNIGTLNSFAVLTNLGLGCTYNGPSSVGKNEPLNATITIGNNYEFNNSNIIVTMGSNIISEGIVIEDKLITINIPSVTGVITIIVSTENINPDIPNNDTISGTLFLQNGALSVVKGENFYVNLKPANGADKRMNSSSLTEATGILVPDGATITLTGTSGLRFDYVYATSPGPNSSTDKSSNVIGGVGTASNFKSSDYFPLNADGSENTISITNGYGQDYYYHFAIAAPNKTDSLNLEDYHITYEVVLPQIPTDYPTSGTLPLENRMVSVVSNEGFFLGSKKTNRMTSGSSTEETGIFIPKGKTITLTGISGLRMDYVWADNPGPCSSTRGEEWGGIGAASNFVAADYFPLNIDGSSDTVSITNDKGNYYFFFCFAAPDKNATISVADYNITWEIS